MIRKFFVAILALIFPLVFVTSVLAQSNNQGIVTLPKEEVVDRDYFASGNTVILSGTVNGDAYLAGGNIIVEGTINGDLLAAGGTIEIKGQVANNVRVIGGQVINSGTIGANMSVVAGSVDLTDQSNLNGSLAAATGNLLVFGPVGKGITSSAGQVTLGNSIGGDVVINTNQLSLTSGAKINGDLTYTSTTMAKTEQGFLVSGRTTQKFPPRNQFEPIKVLTGISLVGKVISLVTSLIIGLLLLRFVPQFSLQTSKVVMRSLGLSLGWGVLALILVPIISVILFITIIGIPIALILLAIFLIVLYLAKIFVFLAVGQKIAKRFKWKISSAWMLFIGLVIYAILTLIPVINFIVVVFTGVIGLGAILIAKKRIYLQLRDNKLI